VRTFTSFSGTALDHTVFNRKVKYLMMEQRKKQVELRDKEYTKPDGFL
jgi:hypothetical protein